MDRLKDKFPQNETRALQRGTQRDGGIIRYLQDVGHNRGGETARRI